MIDQLRDVPTRYSVLYIHAFIWIDSYGNVIGAVTHLPGYKITTSIESNVLHN